MRNLMLTFLLIFGGGHLCLLGLPWWTLVLWSAAAAYFFPSKLVPGVVVAFVSAAFLWFLYAYLPDAANGSLLSTKLGQVFLGAKPWHLLLVTAFLGGILGKLGYLSGHTARAAFVR